MPVLILNFTIQFALCLYHPFGPKEYFNFEFILNINEHETILLDLICEIELIKI